MNPELLDQAVTMLLKAGAAIRLDRESRARELVLESIATLKDALAQGDGLR